jgi:hypothetical protein
MADTNLNRRCILAGAVALASPVAAVPALAATPAPADPDAALIALCGRFRAEWAAMNHLPDDDDVTDAAGDCLWQVEDEIAELPATTTRGLAAKAGVIRTAYRGTMADASEGILDSLLRDIVAPAGEAAHV